VPRFFRGTIAAFSLSKVLSAYRRLLENEFGAYWTFLYYTGAQFFIGATPERQLSVQGGRGKMEPISGTLRKMDYDEEGALPALEMFLKDPK
jgi:phenazine biosynthesis protein phzE